MAIRIDDVDLDRDRALVQRFQAGDGRAFDELYGRYRHRLERFCLKRVGDPHAAEEVAQEAFTRALAALPAFGGERRFYPWVSVIASRLCVDHHRNQARSEPASEIDCPPVAGGEDAIVDAVDAELVTTAMARLGPRHQDVLRLREVEGWSYRKIADHYGVPIGTIETLLFRARRALRREFDIIDGAGLAAIPFFGWLVHSLGRARDRLAPVVSLSSAQTTLAAAATATAAAVAIVVVPGNVAPAPTPTQVVAGPAQAAPGPVKPAVPVAAAPAAPASPSAEVVARTTTSTPGPKPGESVLPAPVTTVAGQQPAVGVIVASPPVPVPPVSSTQTLTPTLLPTPAVTPPHLPDLLGGTAPLPVLPLNRQPVDAVVGQLATVAQPGALVTDLTLLPGGRAPLPGTGKK